MTNIDQLFLKLKWVWNGLDGNWALVAANLMVEARYFPLKWLVDGCIPHFQTGPFP